MPGSNKKGVMNVLMGSVPLKLSGKIHKQLESIARSRGVLPKKLLNEMIEQAYQDFVANEQHKTLS